MAKSPTIQKIIEQNRSDIATLYKNASPLMGARIKNRVSSDLRDETLTLFQYPDWLPRNEKSLYLDYTSMHNLVMAWDYITAHRMDTIDMMAIRKIHSILATDTDIAPGQFRFSDAYIEQLKINAPKYHDMLQKLDDVQYSISDSRLPALNRAFNAHFDIIAAQPFNDFNKRTARLIMNWVLIQHGYTPILFTKKSDKQDYMSALRDCVDGKLKDYSHYLYSCMIRNQSKFAKLIARGM